MRYVPLEVCTEATEARAAVSIVRTPNYGVLYVAKLKTRSNAKIVRRRHAAMAVGIPLTHSSKNMVYLRQTPLQDLLDPDYATSDAAGPDDPPGWLFEDAAEASEGGADWKLTNCCGTDEIVFICLLAGYLVIIFFLWNTIVMKPMKLISVFVHGERVFL